MNDKRLLVLSTFLAGLIGLVQIWPHVGFSYAIVQTNRQLFRAFQAKLSEPVLLPHSQNDAAVDTAISLLNNALRQKLDHSLPYRLLIRSYVARGDWRAALEVSRQAEQSLVISNANIFDEIAIPRFYWIGQQQACIDVAKSEIDLLKWFITSNENLGKFADQLLFEGQPIAARGAYCVMEQLSSSVDLVHNVFGETSLAIMARTADSQTRLQQLQASDPLLATFRVDRAPITILPAQLRWLTKIPQYNVDFGSQFALPDAKFGVFWWSGQAVAIIEVANSGTYTIEASFRDAPPAPVHMAVGIDGVRLQRFEFQRGNNSWQTVDVTAKLADGIHLINVWFLNNTTINGKDRDGSLQWLRIQSVLQ